MKLDTLKLLSDMQKKHPDKKHPKIILTQDDINGIKNAAYDPVMQLLVKKNKAQCEKLLNAPLERHVIPDGIRLLATSRRILAATIALAVGYNITGDTRFAERAYIQLEAAANFPDWNPKHTLDTAEMCAAFGIGYDLLFEYLGKERLAILRNAMLKLGISQIMQDYENSERNRTYRWYQSTPGNNWKLVCNGGVAVASLAILDEVEGEDKEMCLKALEYGFESSYDLIRAVFRASDGDYFEGIGYWEYACNYLAYHCSALISACGSDYGLSDCEAIRKTPYFVIQMCGNTSYPFNFSDSGYGVTKPFAMLFFASILKNPSIASVRVDAIKGGAYNQNDLLYYKSGYYAPVDTLPKYFGAVGADNVTLRSGWDVSDVFCAVHFGRSDIPHAHLDTGTFILESEGERFFIDLGSDNYNLKPYSYAYRYRAEGHNTLVFNPSAANDQERVSNCLITEFENTDDIGYAACDISAAYPGKKVVRSVKLDRTLFSVTLSDDIECDENDVMYWFAHTNAAVTLSDDAKIATLTQNGKRLRAEILSGQSFYVTDAKPFPTSPIPQGSTDQDGVVREQATNEGVRKLAIRCDSGTQRHIKVSFCRV